MTNIEKLHSWIASPQRDYAAGLSLFKALGRKPAHDLYLRYLEQGKDAARLSQLEGCLRNIIEAIKIEPKLYPAAHDEYGGRPTAATAKQVDDEIMRRVKEIAVHDDKIESLRSSLVELTERNDDTATNVEELQDEIRQHEETISQLQDEVEELRKPGVKFIKTEEAPFKIRAAQRRIKEIVPLMASLHASLSDTTISDSERKQTADQLCRLSDERRKLWNEIDEWSTHGTPDNEQPADPVQQGYKIARRIERLQANILYAQRAADDAEAAGRQTIRENALRRLESYRKELEELQEKYSYETPQ